jgi:two-component system, cell cycle response regulator
MKILVVDDSKTEACWLRLVLERMGHEVIFADGGEAAWSALERDQIAVVISDWMMPDMNGLELCRRIRAREGHYTYFILLTSRDNNGTRLEGLRAGADDFLSKPANLDELAVHLEMARRILETQEELQRKNERLEALAITDGLTELNNRRYFFEVMESQFARYSRQHSPLSLVMLDVDEFKSFNDAFGHPAGDQVLREVADVLRTNCRSHDIVARYGGEEFALLLTDADDAVARETAERLRAALEHRGWPHRAVTASFGVATMTGQTCRPDELVQQADQALYHSKRCGRNRVTHARDIFWYPEVDGGSAAESREVTSLSSSPTDDTSLTSQGIAEDPTVDLDELASGRLAREHDDIVESFIRILDLREAGSSEHGRRTTALTMKLVQALGFDESEFAHIRRGALLHDIGKIGVPDAILLKRGPLTEEEWVEMRKHPAYALEMLETIEFLRPALDIPYAHHERWDGTGYPRGIAGEEIPKAARAFAISDIYDALIHDRPYRSAWSRERALDYIDGLAGTHLDPVMVKALRRVLKPKKEVHREPADLLEFPESIFDDPANTCYHNVGSTC